MTAEEMDCYKARLEAVIEEAYENGYQDGRKGYDSLLAIGYDRGFKAGQENPQFIFWGSDEERGMFYAWDLAHKIFRLWFELQQDANEFNNALKLGGKLSDDVMELMFAKNPTEIYERYLEYEKYKATGTEDGD